MTLDITDWTKLSVEREHGNMVGIAAIIHGDGGARDTNIPSIAYIAKLLKYTEQAICE